MPGEAMLKHAFGAHRSSVVFLVKKFSLNGLSALETRPTSFTLRSIPKAQISDVTYKHKGSWYTPPGPKLPEGDEIDYLPPAEAIGYVSFLWYMFVTAAMYMDVAAKDASRTQCSLMRTAKGIISGNPWCVDMAQLLPIVAGLSL